MFHPFSLKILFLTLAVSQLVTPLSSCAASTPKKVIKKIKSTSAEIIKAPTQKQFNSFEPDIIAKQAYLVSYAPEKGTLRVLLEKNAHQRMAPSSMTKMAITCLAARKIQNKELSLDTEYIVSERAFRMGGSRMFLNYNQNVKVSDLLKGVIIQSGNDAATTLAEGIFGSVEACGHALTSFMHKIGATNTNFVNPTGWPDPNHYSTAYDLMLLALEVLKDKEIYPLHAEKEFTFNGIKQGNRNPLLYKNTGCDGIKTGSTDEGGYGVVATCKQGNQRLILVVNGLPSMQARADETSKLMNWGFGHYQTFKLFSSQKPLDTVPVSLGEKDQVRIGVSEDLWVTLSGSEKEGIKATMFVQAPLKGGFVKGTKVGYLEVSIPSLDQTHKIPLVAQEDVKPAGFFKTIKDSLNYVLFGL